MSTPDRRRVAIAGHTGDAATARAGLTAADAVVRATALGALDRLGLLTDADVTTALGDSDAPVRRRAATLAATRPAVDLTAVLDDRDPSVVEVAAWACGERQTVDGVVVARLVALVGDTTGDALVREAAVAALGAIGDERGLEAILAATEDKPAIRRRAVLALAPFLDDDHPRASEIEGTLQRALADRDWQVRQAAEDLLPAD
jgi:HEAT repeat protein